MTAINPAPIEVALVIRLTLPERRRRFDLSRNGLSQRATRVDGRLALTSNTRLLVIVSEDDTAILPTDVRALTINLRRVVQMPEHVDKRGVRNL